MSFDIIDNEQKPAFLTNGIFYDFVCEYLIEIKNIENKKEVEGVKLVGRRSYILASFYKKELIVIKSYKLQMFRLKKLTEKLND